VRKIILILLTGLLWNNISFADLILNCKQEVRISNIDGVSETISMSKNWKIKITKTQIHVLGYESLYPSIMRKKEKESENIYYGEDNNDNEHNSIKIDLITGVGKFYLKSGTTVAKDILKCSN